MVTRSEPESFLREQKVAYTRSDIYLGVTFVGPRFSLHDTACVQFSNGYAALAKHESQSAHLQFPGPQTKLWLFDTLVTLSLLYEVVVHSKSQTIVNHELSESIDRNVQGEINCGAVTLQQLSAPETCSYIEMGTELISSLQVW